MGGVELVASVRPKRAEALSNLDAVWANTISDWSVPGRFAFFIFHIHLSYPAEDWFPGLELQLCDDGYYVGGSLDAWDRACYALLNTGSPSPCCRIYRQVYESLTGIGYKMTGKRSSSMKNFYLQ